MDHWITNSIFYHIYPLGLCGAPQRNDFNSPPQPRLAQVYEWLDHIQCLGANAIYLGPLFESTAHGYDTADYYHVDRRLGTNETLARLSATLHQRGIRLILDGVFNHVGRDFWAFRDVQANRERSPYATWFHNLTFGQRSPYGDPFSYEGWNGHYDLVKLNLRHPDVRQHLLKAVAMWIQEFDIDGLRLDAADQVDMEFLKELAAFCRRLRPDFWLLGEIVFGDYRRWVQPGLLDAVTNYECYKGLYSSHVDRNYFEIAYAFNRQFGNDGIYQGMPLYGFADNHDVSRVASSLTNPAHLYPLHCLLFTMPGVPSIYYGSEWGIQGHKNGNDWLLRPQIDLATVTSANSVGQFSTRTPPGDLARVITRLAAIRRSNPALRRGDYTQLLVNSQQLAFCRRTAEECVIVAVNAAEQAVPLEIEIPLINTGWLEDWLNPGERFPIVNGRVHLNAVMPCWGRILVYRPG